MNLPNFKQFCFFNRYMNSRGFRCICLVLIVLLFRALLLLLHPSMFKQSNFNQVISYSSPLNPETRMRNGKFLKVPQIVWGLNNQKIAFARASLTARFLNRTLLMPSLSASLFYKEIDKLEPVSFEKIFQFEKFNQICNGFVQLGRFSDLSNRTREFELQKGSGRKWSKERDLEQLKMFNRYPFDEFEVIQITGKNPFLWHDHWPVKDYAKIFECLVLVDEIAKEAEKVVFKIRKKMKNTLNSENSTLQTNPYIAVHMRIEKDWMIHCKKQEQRYKITQICSSKEEIMSRVSRINGVKDLTVIYLAVADILLEDPSILRGWRKGLIPFEKKKLGVWDIYRKYPYLIQSAIDYEVCLRADIFVGNSYSTFSSLIVMERSQKLIKMGFNGSCKKDLKWGSYAYNILGEFGGPQKWFTDMNGSSLQAISYGSNNISC